MEYVADFDDKLKEKLSVQSSASGSVSSSISPTLSEAFDTDSQFGSTYTTSGRISLILIDNCNLN